MPYGGLLVAGTGMITAVKRTHADAIAVHFDKHRSSDELHMPVGDGEAALELATGVTQANWATLEMDGKLQHIGRAIEGLMGGEPFA